MAVPLMQAVRVGAYVVKQHLRGRKRYPLVLMLEPLFRCNLACAGCGKIDYPAPILNQRLSVQECLDADTECGAPVIAVAGGEPLLHKEMPEIIRQAPGAQESTFISAPTPCCWRRSSTTTRRTRSSPGTSTWTAIKEMHDASVCQDGVYRPRGGGDPQGQGARLPGVDQLHRVRRRQAGAAGGVLRRR